ncbi:MAG: transketolase [Candidatus Eisenbacteria sp.]|nr:transketolase [Candidatus Eisenbacteria bacterium]
MNSEELDWLCINTLRTLSIDMVEQANSGHPGLPLGAAPMAFVLWHRHLKHDPKAPEWPDRDRFVLSPGHGSALLYTLLHLSGYDVTLDDLRSFRQWGSRTPGHPEFRCAPGVEATTGPLGQGAANAVGMAIAERALAARFNRPGHTLVDHYTYAMVSDGDLMEGISAEAASLAGHLQLGKLICLYDANDVSLEGPLSLAFTEDVAKRYEAHGWQVLRVEEGDKDLDAMDRAIAEAKSDSRRPSILLIKTTLGYGSPNKQGKSSAHGSPLGAEEVALTKQALGWDPDRVFHVPDEAVARFRSRGDESANAREDWERRLDGYAREHPQLAEEWRLAMAGRLPEGWAADLPRWKSGESVATRKASGSALNAIAANLPRVMGGDADLSSSTNTALKDAGDFHGLSGDGRNIHFGVREHAMGSIANGMAYHGGIRPYTATFFVFSDYMKPSVRLAAMSGLPVIFVWTHDSIAVGEDGPTHQPVEHLAALRIIPNLHVFRPGDANEAAEAWRYAILRVDGPTALVLGRQGLPVLDRERFGPSRGVLRGAYIMSDPEEGQPEAIIIATGSEVHVALAAQELLADEGVAARVVSMPSWEAFQAQDKAYRDSVLLPRVQARVAVEAGVRMGWERWVGDAGEILGIERFGASAPGETNMQEFGFTAEAVAEAVKISMASNGVSTDDRQSRER